jgi:hypothetical protein
MKLVLATLVTLQTAQLAPAPVIYACSWGDQSARLNISEHRAQIAGLETELNEGLLFNFKTNGGVVVMDLGDPDVLHFDKPKTIMGTVEPNIPVRCSLAR